VGERRGVHGPLTLVLSDHPASQRKWAQWFEKSNHWPCGLFWDRQKSRYLENRLPHSAQITM
jgi:hypothetical protein